MLKSKVITLPAKVHIVKATVFPVVTYGCESWTIKKAECQRIDAFELWCWRRLLDCKKIKLVNPKGYQLRIFIGKIMKLQYFEFSSVSQSCPTLHDDPMNCSMPGFPVLHYFLELLKFMSIESLMPFNHLILYYPLLLLPSIILSIKVFSNELALFIKWPKYWSFSFSISLPMNIQDWFPLGLTSLISLLSKGLSRVFFSITVWKHQFFGTQPSLWSNRYIISLEKP